MPLVTPAAPKPSIEALHAMLPAFVASAGIRQAAPHFAASLLAAPQSLASPALSYPVYALGLADVASGAGIRRAKLSAWRYEYAAGGEVVSAEVSAGRRPQFTGLNVNSRFRPVSQELRSAGEAADFAAESYEVRLLQISAMGVRALWLKAKSRSHADVVIPLAPTRAELNAGGHYSPRAFTAALKEAAEAMVAAEAPGKGARTFAVPRPPPVKGGVVAQGLMTGRGSVAVKPRRSIRRATGWARPGKSHGCHR